MTEKKTRLSKVDSIIAGIDKKFPYAPASVKDKALEKIKEQLDTLSQYKAPKRSRIDLKIKGKTVDELKLILEKMDVEDKQRQADRLTITDTIKKLTTQTK